MTSCHTLGCPPLLPGRNTISHCTVCHRTFASHRIGDRHRVGSFDPDTRRCLTDWEMRGRAWIMDDRGYWHDSRIRDAGTLTALTAHRPGS